MLKNLTSLMIALVVAPSWLSVCSVTAQTNASEEQGASPGLRGTLPVPVIKEPTLEQLDITKGQNWRRASMQLSGSMCQGCLLELEGKLRHQLGVTFSHVTREPVPQQQQSDKIVHKVATAVVIYDLRFIDLNEIEKCVKRNEYKASEIIESAKW
jgi:hypothetical protein